MRAITGAVVSSEPCTLTEAHDMLSALCSSRDPYLESSDCPTYILALDNAIREHHKFLRRCGRSERQQGAANHDAYGHEALVEGEGERQGGGRYGDTEVSVGGPHGSVEEADVAVAAGERKSKKRKKEEEPSDDKADAGVPSHAPASREIVFEQRKKKEKHSSNKLVSAVKQEPDLVVEEDGGSERRKKKKEKHSDRELARVVKQEPGLVVEEELVSEKKKAKKKREKDHVKLEEDVVEAKGQIVNDGVVEQGVADGEKKKKKRKHSEEEGDSKGVKEEEDKMAIGIDLNSEKKKKKKKRGREDDDDVQEQGEHKKKKQRKESRE